MKIKCVAIVVIIFIGGSELLASYGEETKFNTISVSFSFPSFEEFIIKNHEDEHKIEIDGFSYLMIPGKPLLPSKNFVIFMPPNSEIKSFKVDIINEEEIDGRYKIASSPFPVMLYKNIYIANEENYSDEFCPQEMVRIKSYGTFREYPYISISVCPFKYYQKTGKLFYYKELKLTLEFSSNIKFENAYYKISPSTSFFVNLNEIKNIYKEETAGKDEHNYLVISTEELFDSIKSSEFIKWKKSLGYNIKIVNITDNEISNQQGKDIPQKLRNFLRQYYLEWNTRYILIIGSHEKIPMRYCYPNPLNHRFEPFDWTSGEVPTDYYYADLSFSDEESWDSDGDGFYGEYGEDNPDFMPDVYVGRIPVDEDSKVLYTLNKIVSFEKDCRRWKNSALNAGAFFYFENEDNNGYPAMDGAVVSYYIEKDIMKGWNISHYSEQEGLEKSVYEWPALSEESFINDWKNGRYAVVNWQGHGWTDSVARKVWVSDDGDGVPEANEISWPRFITVNSNLDDDYPSIVTALSCYVNCPETYPTGNLGIKLLTDPSFGSAVAVIASARSPYGNLNWPETKAGSESIIYEFNKKMISENQKVGEAFYNAKFYCTTNYGWEHYVEYLDMYTFNLYGDPSLRREGVYSLPDLEIIEPYNGIYFKNSRIFPFFLPLIFGNIDVKVHAENSSYVEFYIDDELKFTDYEPPYIYTWNESAFFRHSIMAIAYNENGESDEDSIYVWKFF